MPPELRRDRVAVAQDRKGATRIGSELRRCCPKWRRPSNCRSSPGVSEPENRRTKLTPECVRISMEPRSGGGTTARREWRPTGRAISEPANAAPAVSDGDRFKAPNPEPAGTAARVERLLRERARRARRSATGRRRGDRRRGRSETPPSKRRERTARRRGRAERGPSWAGSARAAGPGGERDLGRTAADPFAALDFALLVRRSREDHGHRSVSGAARRPSSRAEARGEAPREPRRPRGPLAVGCAPPRDRAGGRSSGRREGCRGAAPALWAPGHSSGEPTRPSLTPWART